MINETLKSLKLLKSLISFGALMFFLFSLPNKVSAQYYVSGNNLSTIKYCQIKTKKFHIVFPNYYEEKAQELARILDTLLPNVANSLQTKAPLVPVLLHPSSAKSNGLSVWAPKRMEFWATPSVDTYSYPYLWQLAIHEYRHSSQMEAMNVGITESVGKIFGEHILAALSSVWIPNWFFEGDAVTAETALAPTGRGQTPEYNMKFKAMIEANKYYKSDKVLLGSMKDFVLDSYNLGYFMTSYARMQYGSDIWGDCLKNIGKNWWKLISWGNTGRKNIDLNFDKLYAETLSFMQTEWKKQDSSFSEPKYEREILTNKNDYYCNYKNPIQIDDTTIFALKSSNYETQHLVKITPYQEEILLYVPYLLNSYFACRDSCILYSQYSPDFRWKHESSADVIEYDLNKDKYRRITSNTILFNPIYYPFDSVLAAIKTDSTGKQSLTVITSNSRFFKNRHFNEKIRSSYLANIYLEGSYAFSYPAWEEETGDIFLISTDTKGKHIVRYSTKEEKFTDVTSPSFDNITKLKLFNKRLFFIKDVNNRNQLLSLDIDNPKDVKIHSNERYGIDSYDIYDSTIILSTYTAEGYKLVRIAYNEEKYNLEETSPLFTLTLNNRMQENFLLTDDIINHDTVFKVSKYKKYTHMFNFHSWAPLFVDIEAEELGWGVSFMSQNLLSTSVLTAGFNYHFNDKNKLFIHHRYSGFYAILDLILSYRPRDISHRLDSNSVRYVNFDEINVQYDMSLPFSWVNRNFYNNITFGFHYLLTDIFNNEDALSITLFNSVGYSMSISNYSVQADNDIYPRWGHILKGKYIKTLTSDNAYILAASTQVFFPGLMQNHSFSIIGSLQFNTPDIYYFPNEINFVRGVYSIYPKKYYGLLALYSLPLWYPDGGVKKFVYVKRISLTPFYNIGMYDKKFFRSFGTDISFRTHIFRITVPLELGARIGYQRETKDFFASLLFNINV